MSQLSLFDSRRPADPPKPDITFIRKTLNRALRQVRAAEIMPWDDARATRWATEFPELATHLPPDEGALLARRFSEELARLRKAPSPAASRRPLPQRER